MPNAQNVSTGKPKVTGAIYRAPLGTVLPASAAASLASAFRDLGYVSEDGVKNSNEPSSENIKAWGGAIVLVVQTERPDEWTFKLIESLNPNVLETVYGTDNVAYNAEAGTITVQAKPEQLVDSAYVIDTVMKGGALKRVVIPSGSLSALAEIVYKDDEAVGYEITVTALPDASGVTHYEYIVLPAGVSAEISLDKSTLSVAANATSQLVATTTPEGGRVLWGTSDPTKATVDQSGLVTGVAAGSAVITAYYGGLTASCTVTVTN